MSFKIFTKGNYFYIVDNATNREYNAFAKDVLITRGATSQDDFFIGNVANWSESNHLDILEIQDENGDAYVLSDFITFYENNTGFSSGGSSSSTTNVGITTEQSDAIDLNTDKVGITDEQATDISENTLAKHEHLNKAIIDSFAEDENQNLTYNGKVVGSDSENQLVTQTLLYDRVTWASELNKAIPVKTTGNLGKLNDDAFITVEADGLYEVTVQLNFGKMTVGERLNFGLLNAEGALFPDTGQSFVTPSNDNSWYSSQIERTTWRVNLVAGDQLYVGISTNSSGVEFNVYSSATHNGSYIELRQLPTHTVVPVISEEVVPVTALENHYIPYAVDVDWDSSLGTSTGVVFTLPPVSSDGRYFVDYGLNISPIESDSLVSARTHIRINGDEAPWTTRYTKDNSTDVSNSDFKYMNGGSYLNLEAGDEVTLYMESAVNVTLNGHTSSNTHVSFIRMNQLPTHTVVPTISEEAVVVDDQASSGYVDIGTMRVQWGTLTASFISSFGDKFTYPVPFGNVPNLTGSLTEDGSQGINLTFRSVTAVGASAALRLLDSSNFDTDSHTVSWMAIGLKP